MISWPFMVTELGSLSNYDDDHNDDFKKNNRFNDQNNSSALASCFLVHFFDVHCTITTWNLLICRFIEDVDMRRRFFFLFLNQNKILKNSTPGKVACIWHNERVQIDAIKFEKTQIHFFLPTFSLPSCRPCLRSLIDSSLIYEELCFALHLAMTTTWREKNTILHWESEKSFNDFLF